MKKLLPLAMVFGLMMPLANAQKPAAEPAKEKPAAADTKKPEAAKPKEAATDKKKEKATAPSAADKKLMAEAKKVTAKLTAEQNKKALEMVNTGDEKTIEAVEGIGEVKAKAIVAKRPFAKLEDVVMVEGIGIETYKNILATVNPAVKEEKTKEGDKKGKDAKDTKETKEKTTKPEAKPEGKPATKKPS